MCLEHGISDQNRLLSRPRRYIQQVPLALLRLALPPGHPSLSAALDDWRLRLTYFMYQTLGDLRISEMFDIVIDYPDSAPAVAEAGACLKHTSLAPKFVSVFKVCESFCVICYRAWFCEVELMIVKFVLVAVAIRFC